MINPLYKRKKKIQGKWAHAYLSEVGCTLSRLISVRSTRSCNLQPVSPSSYNSLNLLPVFFTFLCSLILFSLSLSLNPQIETRNPGDSSHHRLKSPQWIRARSYGSSSETWPSSFPASPNLPSPPSTPPRLPASAKSSWPTSLTSSPPSLWSSTTARRIKTPAATRSTPASTWANPKSKTWRRSDQAWRFRSTRAGGAPRAGSTQRSSWAVLRCRWRSWGRRSPDPWCITTDGLELEGARRTGRLSRSSFWASGPNPTRDSFLSSMGSPSVALRFFKFKGMWRSRFSLASSGSEAPAICNQG